MAINEGRIMNIQAAMGINKAASLFDTDYHAHILPGCDHGSDGITTSLRQLAMAREAEVKTLCATSHFYPHRENVDHFLERRAKSYEKLSSYLKEEERVPEILLGAEVLMCEGIEHMEHIDRLCLQGTKELLVEMPMYEFSDSLIDSVLRLHARQDLVLVMAHADRYPDFWVELFIREGIRLQLNVDRLAKRFHNRSLVDWIKKGYVSYLGSDIHGTEVGYKNWNKCRKMQKIWKK